MKKLQEIKKEDVKKFLKEHWLDLLVMSVCGASIVITVWEQKDNRKLYLTKSMRENLFKASKISDGRYLLTELNVTKRAKLKDIHELLDKYMSDDEDVKANENDFINSILIMTSEK